MLIDQGADLTARGSGDRSVLTVALSSDANAEAIEVLLHAGADVSARDEYNTTPLMWAARRNTNPDVIELLLDFGADPTAHNIAGDTAWDFIKENEELHDPDVFRKLRNLQNE